MVMSARRQSFYTSRWNYRNRDTLKLEMVEAYGGCCQSCGENDPVVLVLDHVYDDGRKDAMRGGYKLYGFLKKLGWPKLGYQLLCHNCNYKKEHYRRMANRQLQQESRLAQEEKDNA